MDFPFTLSVLRVLAVSCPTVMGMLASLVSAIRDFAAACLHHADMSFNSDDMSGYSTAYLGIQ